MIYPLIIASVWGSMPILIKLYLSLFPNVFIIFLQSLVLLSSTLIYIFFFKYTDFINGYKSATYKHFLIIALMFFIVTFICNLLYLHILKKDDIIAPLLIFILTPIITIIISALVLKELLNIRQIFGCFLVFIGIFFLVYYKKMT